MVKGVFNRSGLTLRMMGLKPRIYILLLAALSFAAGCESDVVTVADPVQPESYTAIVKAFREGKPYIGAKTVSTATKVFFQDGSSVIVPSAEWTVCPVEDAPAELERVSVEHGDWLFDGERTGRKKTSGSLEESFPVYACYDIKYLIIKASNGEEMVFDNGWEPESEIPDIPPPPPAREDDLHEKVIPASFAIPKVEIFTEGGAKIESKHNWVNATFKFTDPSKFYSEEEILEVKGTIRGRGNTTWGMPKKPYRIKLGEKVKVFGPWGNKDWILLANYSDKTLLRNITMMEVSRICGMSWTPRMLSVEVYLNNSYQGVYSFSDHKEIAGHRVNIEPAGENDLEGGYYLEIEEAMDEPVCFKTSVMDTPVMFHVPEQPTEAQQKYVKDWFNGFEAALSEIQGKKDYTTWRLFADVPSFVNYYIIQEIAKNPDGNVRKSTYITKEKGKPLEMYHVWDFDITLGNCNYTNFEKPDGWQMRYVKWYNQMFHDPGFKKAVVDRWNELYPALLEVPEFIDRQYRLMNGAETANFEKWQILGKYVWPNKYIFDTYQQEYGFLKEFYLDRLAWLNERINSADY